MRTPSFLVIGAEQAGPYKIRQMFRRHPQVCLMDSMDSNFFSNDFNYSLGLSRYMQLYGDVTPYNAIGEICSSYSMIQTHPGVIERIKESCPDIKIVYMVRHPLMRLEAIYMNKCKGPTGVWIKSFEDLLERYPDVIETSLYWRTMSTYMNKVGASSIHIIWFDELMSQPAKTFGAVCDFIGIKTLFASDLALLEGEPGFQDMAITEYRSKPDTIWDSKTRQRVLDLIACDVQQFLRAFNRPDYWSSMFS